MEQFVRDARITQIYEGTNGVQAMDLVTRKITMDDGAVLQGFLDRIVADLEKGGPDLEHALLPAMRQAVASLQEAGTVLLAASPEGRGAAAVNYLRLFAITALGWMWVRIVRASLENGDDATKARYGAIANFYAAHILPQTRALEAAIVADPQTVMALPAELF